MSLQAKTVGNCLSFWITFTHRCCIPSFAVDGALAYGSVVDWRALRILRLLRRPTSGCWRWRCIGWATGAGPHRGGEGVRPADSFLWQLLRHCLFHLSCLAPLPDLHKTECKTKSPESDRNIPHLFSELVFTPKKEFLALLFFSPGCPNVLLENSKWRWGIHSGTFSEHEPESKLYQSQHAVISLAEVKPAVCEGPARLGPNQTWGIRSDSPSSGAKQTETGKKCRNDQPITEQNLFAALHARAFPPSASGEKKEKKFFPCHDRYYQIIRTDSQAWDYKSRLSLFLELSG